MVVVPDACVLVPPTLCDLLLRLAETGRIRLRWNATLLDEVGRNQPRVTRMSLRQIESWRAAVETAFPEAMVGESPGRLSAYANDPKDRHVLDCAVMGGAQSIVTFNLRDFPTSALAPWGVEAVHPSVFLLDLNRDGIHETIQRMASDRGLAPSEILLRLSRFIPEFAEAVG